MKRIIKLVFLSLGVILICGCVNKKALKIDEFDEYFTSNGFEIINAYDQLVKKDNIKGVYIATNGDYQVEYYLLNTIENAKKFYLEDVIYFKKEEAANDKDHNYESFSMEEDNNYIYISRINNTIIYVNCDLKYKEDVKSILKKIDY